MIIPVMEKRVFEFGFLGTAGLWDAEPARYAKSPNEKKLSIKAFVENLNAVLGVYADVNKAYYVRGRLIRDEFALPDVVFEVRDCHDRNDQHQHHRPSDD